MARMPGAIWKPLAANWASQPRMKAYDFFCVHTMVGSLAGTDGYFKTGNGTGYGGTESHFGVGPDGTIWQWQDTDFQADANGNGNWHVISSENADTGFPFPKWAGSDVPALTREQVEANARIAVFLWQTHRIPLDIAGSSKPGARGLAVHRYGVPGYAPAGAELWSTAKGKACPGDRRIAQLPSIRDRAKALAGSGGVVIGTAHPIIGKIREAFIRPGWALFLGAPKGPEVPTWDKIGRWQEFENGAIYWHPDVVDDAGKKGEAHIVYGGIAKKFWADGAEKSLGYPVSDELITPDKVGRMGHFAGGDASAGMPASIYAHPQHGIHTVKGKIRERWGEMNWEVGFGYPTTDELEASGGGRYQRFSFNGTIYWHPETGAQPVYGGIGETYAANGAEWGPLGYPIEEEKNFNGGRLQKFQRGSIAWVAGETSVNVQ